MKIYLFLIFLLSFVGLFYAFIRITRWMKELWGLRNDPSYTAYKGESRIEIFLDRCIRVVLKLLIFIIIIILIRLAFFIAGYLDFDHPSA